ncbi:MAG: HlyC/CorC family transporter [Deltaproteobacteria bacterium]|nr:HlyC/CorC family transporter [Deltaproteobacteria bacterium]
MFLLFLTLFMVIATSFFCSLSEAALLSVSRVRIETLVETSRPARLVSWMKDHLDRPVVAILVLNTIANTAGAAFAGREYQRVFAGANIAIFTVTFTIAVLVFSELLPKTLGVRHAVGVSLLIARPLRLVVTLMRPMTWIVERMSSLLGVGKQTGVVSLDDLRAMARLAVHHKALGREGQMIIESASRLPRMSVDQLMIHREDIVFLALADPAEKNLIKARRSMHTRVILCHHSLDDIVGFVNVKDVLWRIVDEPDLLEDSGLARVLGEAVRTPLEVRESMDVSGLLQCFSMNHEHLAIVKDDQDHVVGMVTLEDVVEELIGEVDDEYDRSPDNIEFMRTGLYRLGGGTPWSKAAEVLKLPSAGLHDVDLDGRFDVNDLAADMLRGKLRTGGVFSMGRWRFKVTRMRRGKVLHVEALLLGQPSEADEAGQEPMPVA